MGKILDTAEALWTGESNTYSQHPFGPPYGVEPITEGVWFYKGFAGTTAVETQDGLVMIDPASMFDSQVKFDAFRQVTSSRLNTAIFSHGHTDHVFGVELYVAESQQQGWPKPVVIAHQAMPARFRRYRRTDGWNSVINSRQFRGGVDQVPWPRQYYEPDITYAEKMDISVGGVPLMIRHSRGETDDHTWVYFPEQKVLCTGDLFIWAVPNTGNPQKVQRYASDWARGLREMAALGAEYLLPGHGFPVMGADRVHEALSNTAALLESLQNQTIDLMNQGASLDQLIHGFKVPADLAALPYLQPVYDEPEFIVRNIYRLYGGWYDGTPSHLKPAPEAAQALEIAGLAGGADKLAARAEKLAQAGDFRLACHLADWAHLAAPEDQAVSAAASRIYLARAKAEPSTMAMGIYMAAAQELGGGAGEGRLAKGQLILAQSERGELE